MSWVSSHGLKGHRFLSQLRNVSGLDKAPYWGRSRGNWLMFFSFSLSPSLSLSLKINKIFKMKLLFIFWEKSALRISQETHQNWKQKEKLHSYSKIHKCIVSRIIFPHMAWKLRSREKTELKWRVPVFHQSMPSPSRYVQLKNRFLLLFSRHFWFRGVIRCTDGRQKQSKVSNSHRWAVWRAWKSPRILSPDNLHCN